MQKELEFDLGLRVVSSSLHIYICASSVRLYVNLLISTKPERIGLRLDYKCPTFGIKTLKPSGYFMYHQV